MTGIPTYKQFNIILNGRVKMPMMIMFKVLFLHSLYNLYSNNPKHFGLSLKLKDRTIVVLELLKVMAKIMGPIPSHR